MQEADSVTTDTKKLEILRVIRCIKNNVNLNNNNNSNSNKNNKINHLLPKRPQNLLNNYSPILCS